MGELGSVKMSMADWRGAMTDLERSFAIRLSLGLEQHPHTRLMFSLLAYGRQQYNQGKNAEPLLSGEPSHLLQVIGQVEKEHRAWVSQDPTNRHFGPLSFVATPQKTK